MSAALERDLRAIYGAYDYLKQHDVVAGSSTSRLLHRGDLPHLALRAREELAELDGVVAGTHGHGGGSADVVLEAYQSLYWLIVLAVAAGDRYDDVRPHEGLEYSEHPTRLEGLDSPARDAPAALAASSPALLDAGPDLADPQRRREALRNGFARVGAACRAAGVSPAEAVRRDLAELRAKPYLAPYWARVDATL